jgi:hypothetical protein
MYRKITFKKTNLFNDAYPFIITIIFLVASILLIIRHEFWRDEVISWQFGSETSSFSEFIKVIDINGNNTYLWFALLYFVSHFIINNPEIMKVIHLIISTASVFLILKYAPFNKIIRAMIVFSYFFFYEYSIISRNYALGILCIVVFCILYKNKYRNILPISITLFFIGQANILSFMISIALFLMLLIEFFIERKFVIKNIKEIYIISSLLIVFSGIFLVYLQIDSQISMSYSQPSVSSILGRSLEENSVSAMHVASNLVDAYIPIPQYILNFWDNNRLITNLLSNYKFLYTYILSGVLFIIPIFVIKRKVILPYILGSILILFIPFFIWRGYIRHFGHLFILFLFCIWLSKINVNDRYLINFKGKTNNLLQTILLYILLLPSLNASSVAFIYDWQSPFSNGKNVAEYVKNNFNEDNLMIVGHLDYLTETITGYLNKDIYYPNSKSIKKLVDWHNRIDGLKTNEVFSEADYFAAEYDQVLVINSSPVEEKDIPLNYIFLNSFNNAIVATENYYLYVFNKNNFMSKTDLILTIDYSNFNNYWTPVNQCKFVFKNKLINIKVEGDDPYFQSTFSFEFKNKLPLLLLISINSPVNGRFQVFYKRADNIYNEEDSRIFTLFEGENIIYVGIPYSENLESIRIDPIDKNQDCVISKMDLYYINE